MISTTRQMIWAMVGFNVLLLVAMVAGVVPPGGAAWFLGNGVLAVLWVARAPRLRVCPQCCHRVPRTFLVCTVCRHDLIRPRPRGTVRS